MIQIGGPQCRTLHGARDLLGRTEVADPLGSGPGSLSRLGSFGSPCGRSMAQWQRAESLERAGHPADGRRSDCRRRRDVKYLLVREEVRDVLLKPLQSLFTHGLEAEIAKRLVSIENDTVRALSPRPERKVGAKDSVTAAARISVDVLRLMDGAFHSFLRS